MKPIIKRQTTYSVLLMRDDSGVMQFRMRAIWLKLLCFLFMLIILVAGGGIWGTHYFWKKYSNLQPRYRKLEQTVAENKQKLQQLDFYARNPDPAVASPAMVSMNATNATVSALPALSAANSSAATAPGIPGVKPLPLPPKDHPVKISGMNLRSTGNKVSMEFNLENQNSVQPISGNIVLALITSKGVMQNVAVPANQLRISKVNQYKSFDISFTIPDGDASSGITAVQLTVNSDGNPTYVERFTMPQTPQ